MNIRLYVDGKLKAQPATIEEARALAIVFFKSVSECVIERAGWLQPMERWRYDYDLQDWVSQSR